MSRFSILLLLYAAVLYSTSRFVSASPLCCSKEPALYLYDLRSQCASSISIIPPLEVDRNFLVRVLSGKQKTSHTSVLFYASWCPFSDRMHLQFGMLSYIFPQIDHLAVEQSSALPSIYSRYGIHSFPSILVFNQTNKVCYHGQKDLQSLVKFYEKLTGLEPAQHIAEDEANIFECEHCIMQPAHWSSVGEMMKREPYLIFAMLFLCLRVVLFLSLKLFSRFKAFYGSYVLQFNLEIFGGTSQLFSRILHVIDVRRIWRDYAKRETFMKVLKIAGFGLPPWPLFPWASLPHQLDHNSIANYNVGCQIKDRQVLADDILCKKLLIP